MIIKKTKGYKIMKDLIQQALYEAMKKICFTKRKFN